MNYSLFPLYFHLSPVPYSMMKDKLLNWINTILVIDFFLVILGFGWFAIAVVGNASGINLGLNLWHKLWQPLFNPAIGLLMGGALISGISSWISKNIGKKA